MSPQTWTRTAAGVFAPPLGANGLTHARILNGTRTGGPTTDSNFFTLAAATAPAAAVIIFQINKAASTYALKCVSRNVNPGTTAPTAITTAQLKTAMQLPLMSDIATYLATLDANYAETTDATGIVTGATYEATNGAFNAVHLAWNKPACFDRTDRGKDIVG